MSDAYIPEVREVTRFPLPNKPVFLIMFSDYTFFLSIGKPSFFPDFIETKGVFIPDTTTNTDDYIRENYTLFLDPTKIVDIILPSRKVDYIQNLAYVKSSK